MLQAKVGGKSLRVIIFVHHYGLYLPLGDFDSDLQNLHFLILYL